MRLSRSEWVMTTVTLVALGLIGATIVDGVQHPCVRTERRHTEREVCTGHEDDLHGCSDGHWEVRRVEYRDEVCVERKP